MNLNGKKKAANRAALLNLERLLLIRPDVDGGALGTGSPGDVSVQGVVPPETQVVDPLSMPRLPAFR